MAFALQGARIFDGEKFLDGHAVVIEDRTVRCVAAEGGNAADLAVVSLDGGLLCPGFVDCQVNGGGGLLLNETPDAETVRGIARAHAGYGTTGLLPTVITDAPGVLAKAIAAVRQARAEGERGVLGLHIEGPFIDEARKGAHAAHFIRELTDADAGDIAGAGCGAVMLTVAPNRVKPGLIRQLAAAGVRVSLGHAEATFAEARAALAAGATGFTHLFNAMSQMTGREAGMVGAALADDDSYVGIIADGHHVHDAAMRVAFAAKPGDRMMLVSDAMPPAAGGPDQFELQGRRVKRVDGRLQLDDGTLAGSNLTMDEAVRYCVQVLKIDLARTLRMAALVPAAFLGRGDLGRIAPGALASLVHLDEWLRVRRVWIEGEEVEGVCGWQGQ